MYVLGPMMFVYIILFVNEVRCACWMCVMWTEM